MGDTTNWEFAAAVAAVSIGLGGLLLFTIIGAISSWRVSDRARLAAIQAEKASMAMQELARLVTTRGAEAISHGSPPLLELESRGFADLRRQADALLEQQTRLQEAVRNLVESGVLRADDSGTQLREMEGAIRRLEQHLSQIAAAVANLSVQRQSGEER